MDSIEQEIQDEAASERETYKVYKRRWLVLFAMFNVALVVGLVSSNFTSLVMSAQQL